MQLGLVLEGGGGKGSYQIGIWKALRELGLEEHITAVSGTSVGALNAALYRSGDLDLAESLWRNISPQAMAGDGGSGQKGIGGLVDLVLDRPCLRSALPCHAACRRSRDGAVCYFDISQESDPDRQKRILLASSALPDLYPPVLLDGELYTDGGIDGDICPIRPLFEAGLPGAVVVHLRQNWAEGGPWPGMELLHITPSESLGDHLTGTLDFRPKSARRRMALGYRDGLQQLADLARRARASL